MKKIITTTVLSVIGFSAFSQNVVGQVDQIDDTTIPLNTITTAVPFLIITPDSRAGAMGDAGTATSADVNSFHWNTAKLAFSESKTEIGMSYSPWLRQLVDDIHLSYLAGYHKVSKRGTFGGSLRYFSLGKISFTDQVGAKIRDFSPNEFELLGGYSYKLTDKMALGLNGKFIYSNLTGGTGVGTSQSKAGIAGAADLSFAYLNDEVELGKYDADFSFGATIQNIGNKISYTDAATRDFLPSNLRLGTALKVKFDKFNSLTATVDFNKLLVPTTPYRDPSDTDPTTNIVSGINNEVGVISGMLQSFYDAPGIVTADGNGNFTVEKGSVFAEEMREINIGGGIEYWYSNVLAVRAGYFNEAASKGNRKYLTFGAGLYYSSFGIDVSYLVAVTQNNPLANTVRFSLQFKFGEKSKGNSPTDK
jgi:hypothetical protein